MTKEEAIELDLQFLDAKLVVAAFADPMKTAQNELKAQLEKIKKSWEESNAELIKSYTDAETKVTDLETRLRSAIVELYKAQDDKTIKSGIIPGWGVQVGTKLEYNAEKAIVWAVEHKHLGLLKLDATAFKKIAEVTKPDFVTFKEEPTARIDTKKGEGK